MFCPECRAEYRPGFFTCSDCGIPLVESLPERPEPEVQYVDFEELVTTYNPYDIALLKSLLDAEGIIYYFQGEHFSYVRPLVIPVRLMVRKEDVPVAVEIIKDLELSGVAFTEGEEESDGKG